MTGLLIVYLLINIFVFFLYGLDKHKARKNKFRIPEKTLIFFSVFGILGALCGMKIFHHKTKKNSFYAYIWLIFAIEIILLGYFLYKNQL